MTTNPNADPARSIFPETTGAPLLKPCDTAFGFQTLLRVLSVLVLVLTAALLVRNLFAAGEAASMAPSRSSHQADRTASGIHSGASGSASSREQRELTAARLAKAAGVKLVNEHFDGGQGIQTYLDSWWYDPEQKEYTADITIKWSGAVLAFNQYWVKGSLKVPEAGTSYRFNKSENSDTLSDYQAMKFGVAILEAVTSEDRLIHAPATDTFKGIGARFASKNTGEMLTVDAIVDGTPAARSSLRSGDRIFKINGQDTRPLALKDCVEIIRGDPDDEVSIEIYRPFKANETIEITKEMISVPQ